MHALVIGGTGTVGSLVVKQLLARDDKVSVLTRTPGNARIPGEAQSVAGDLREPNTAANAFQGVDSVFMLNAASVSETYEGVTGVLLAKRAGVRRFVYMSSFQIESTAFLPLGGATKLPIENALKISGIPYTILRPNNFFQNDLWYKESILAKGIYPQQIGFKGMNRVDVRDIADAAVNVLTSDGHHGHTYNVVGPETLTGPSTAASWANALGRDVRYAGNDTEAYERDHAFMGSGLVFPYRIFLEFYQEHGLIASDQDVATVTRLLGRPPRSHQAFAREIAREWQQ
jgi:uncharacterized protein YbjT (DUF2867 family)